MKDLKLKINIGDSQFIVDSGSFTWSRVSELNEKINEIRSRHSVYAKYPFEEGESREKWAERVSKAAQEEYSRQDGETAEAHLKRMFEIKNEAHEMAFEIMNAIAEVFGLKKVTKSDLDKVSWLSLKSFIYDILSMADIPGAEDFLPKRPGV